LIPANLPEGLATAMNIDLGEMNRIVEWIAGLIYVALMLDKLAILMKEEYAEDEIATVLRKKSRLMSKPVFRRSRQNSAIISDASTNKDKLMNCRKNHLSQSDGSGQVNLRA